MRFSVITLFPQLVQDAAAAGVFSRAVAEGKLGLDLVQLRDFSEDARRNVDEHPVGGGDGMVLRPDVVGRAIESVRGPGAVTLMLTPAGRIFDDALARSLAKAPQVLFLCGRYAGFDERVAEKYQTLPVSLGDFVLSGGELPCVLMMDAISRFVPGVLGNEQSAAADSFGDGLLEAPQYTKPLDFEGIQVPEVLLSGDHRRIREYRRREQLRVTAERRPDLLRLAWDSLTRAEQAYVERIWRHARP